MIGDLYDANNVKVGQAAVFVAPVNTPMPTLDATFSTTDPFSTANWPAPWAAVGATEQGWQLGADKSTQKINIEEQAAQVGTTMTSQSVSIQGSLSEDITATLTLAMNATAAATAASASSPGYDDITLSDDPIYYAVGMVTQNPEGFGRFIYAPKWTSLGNVSTAFRRAAGQRLYAVNFETACATSDIHIINITAAHT